jgi:hypothetical protein
VWLGREDSNFRMAESKSDQFANDINKRSGNKRNFLSKPINGLGPVPEEGRGLAAVADNAIQRSDAENSSTEKQAFKLKIGGSNPPGVTTNPQSHSGKV